MAVPTAEELLELAFAKAQAPKRSASGDKAIEQHAIGDLMDAAFKLRNEAASNTAGLLPSLGLTYVKIRGPGGGGGYD